MDNFWQQIKDWFTSEHPEQPLLVTGSARAQWDTFFTELQKQCGARPEDVVTVSGEKSIKVKDVRTALALTQRTSFSGKRLILIPGAQRLRHEAANTLLKELEEPSRTNRFVLATPYRGRMLATIISRCRTVKLPAQLQQAAQEGEPFVAGEILKTIVKPGRKQPLTEEELESINRILQQLVRERSGDPGIHRALLRLRDYYKIRALRGNEKLAGDVLLATLSQIHNTSI